MTRGVSLLASTLIVMAHFVTAEPLAACPSSKLVLP